MTNSPLNFSSEMEMAEFVEKHELAFEEKVKNIIRVINKENLKFIGLTGPSCSGKTTLANKIIEYMERHNKRLCVISIDDFYFDRDVLLEKAKIEGNEEIDFDSVKTIDVDAIEETIEAIEQKLVVSLPHYDFISGKRSSSKTVDSSEYDAFLFEGIQILYPEIYSLFKKHDYKTMFICVEEGISVGDIRFEPNEVRFLRRVVRDYFFRNANGEFSFHLWKGVRKNEDISIFPYVENCDYRINSGMPFEIGLFKPYLEKILGEVSSESKYYDSAQQILAKIAPIENIPKKHLLENSLYREFIPFDPKSENRGRI